MQQEGALERESKEQPTPALSAILKLIMEMVFHLEHLSVLIFLITGVPNNLLKTPYLGSGSGSIS